MEQVMENARKCKICGATQEWVEAGMRKDGSSYEGFWGCPNFKQHPKTGYATYSNPKPGFTSPDTGFTSPVSKTANVEVQTREVILIERLENIEGGVKEINERLDRIEAYLANAKAKATN